MQVKWGPNASLWVNGALMASGVSFTAADSQQPWQGIAFQGAGASASRLENCRIEGASGINAGNARSVVYIENAAPTITGCTLNGAGTGQHGIWVYSGDATLTNNTLSGFPGTGIWINSGAPTVTGNTLSGSGTGIRIEGGGGGLYQNNRLTDNTVGISVSYSNHNPVVGANSYARNAQADMIADGTITTAAGWDDPGSTTYQVGSLTVAAGTRLTIGTGRTLKFGANGTLWVNGALTASGVSFTAADSQQPWQGIAFQGAGASASRLENCRIEGASGINAGNARSVVYIENAAPTITGCTLNGAGTGQHGIWVYSGDATLTNNTLSGFPGTGIWINSGAPTVTGNTLSGSGTGIRIEGGGGGLYQNNRLTDNTVGISVSYSNHNPVVGANSYARNAQADMIADGTITTAAGWDDPGSTTYQVGSLTVAAGTRLTIGTGRTLKFGANGTLWVNGALTASGVSFTAADSQQPWQGIAFQGAGASASRLENCRIEGASGINAGNARSVVYIENAAPTITGCTLNGAGTGQHGIWVYSGDATLTNNTLSGFPGTGIWINSGAPTVTGNTLSGSGTGIRIEGGGGGLYQNNRLTDNTVGISVSYSNHNPVVGANSYARNAQADMIADGTITTAAGWDDPGSTTYQVGSLTVAAGTRLTIGTGRTLKFGANGTLWVNGALTASG